MAMEIQINSCMGSIEVGAGGTTTGSNAHAWLPSEMVTDTTSPSARPSVVSHPLAVVVEGRTSIGFASTRTLTSPTGAVSAPSSTITIRCGVMAAPASG